MTNPSNPDFDSLSGSSEWTSMDAASDAAQLGESGASILDDEETLDDLAELSALSGLDDDFDDESIELGIADSQDGASEDAESADISVDDAVDLDEDVSIEAMYPDVAADEPAPSPDDMSQNMSFALNESGPDASAEEIDADATLDAAPAFRDEAAVQQDEAIALDDDFEDDLDDGSMEGASIAEGMDDDVSASEDAGFHDSVDAGFDDISDADEVTLDSPQPIGPMAEIDLAPPVSAPVDQTLDEREFEVSSAAPEPEFEPEPEVEEDVASVSIDEDDEPPAVARPNRHEPSRRVPAGGSPKGGGFKSVLAHGLTAVVSIAVALALVHFGVIGAAPVDEQPAVSPTAGLEQQAQAQQQALETQEQTLAALQQELQQQQQAVQQQTQAATAAQREREALQAALQTQQQNTTAALQNVEQRLAAVPEPTTPPTEPVEPTAPTEPAETAPVAAAPVDDPVERDYLTASIESLFTQPEQWQDDVDRLEGVANQVRWKAVIDKAASREVAADETWADAPERLTNAELRTWLLTLQAVRLQTQGIALAQAEQSASKASLDVQAALAKLSQAPTTTPTETPPIPNPGTTPQPPQPPVVPSPAEVAEREQLEGLIRNAVASIQARLDGFAPAPAESDEADAPEGDDTPEDGDVPDVGDAPVNSATPDPQMLRDVETVRQLIAGLDDDSLAKTSLDELRGIARQLSETELLVRQWERLNQLQNLVAAQDSAAPSADPDQVASLEAQQKSLAEQLASEKLKLAALQETHDTLAARLTALDRNTATKLTQVEDSLTTTIREEIRNVSAPKPEEIRQLIAAGVQAQLREWGYVLPGTSPAAAPVAEATASPGRARQLFREAYTRVIFSRRDDAAEQAARVMTDAVRNDPQNPLYRYFLGLSLYRLDRQDEAVEQVRIGATAEYQSDTDASAELNHWLERIQQGERKWLEQVRRDVRLGL